MDRVKDILKDKDHFKNEETSKLGKSVLLTCVGMCSLLPVITTHTHNLLISEDKVGPLYCVGGDRDTLYCLLSLITITHDIIQDSR